MLITLSLLALLYVLLGGVIIAAGGGLVVMVGLLAAMALGQLWLSERLALRAMHAQVVSVQDAPGLHALIERLAIQADVPMPQVALSDLPVANAFAMGRSPRHATVCVTAGETFGICCGGALDPIEPYWAAAGEAEAAMIRASAVLVMSFMGPVSPVAAERATGE